MLILVVILISSYLSPREEEQKTVPYSQYTQLLEDGKITSGVVTDKQFVGKLNTPLEDGKTEFKTILPFVNDESVKVWKEKNVDVEFRERETNWVGMLLTSILPWIIFIVIWIFIMRRMSGGGGGTEASSALASRVRSS